MSVATWSDLPEVLEWDAGVPEADFDELLGALVFGIATEPAPGAPPEPPEGDLSKSPEVAGATPLIVVAVAAIFLVGMVVGFAVGYYIGCRLCHLA